ncbi:tail fiber domain-containing protein [Polaromonas sp.]|uniref:tail fiber domain-containing protein n=1 Tax=Polaromonas sp. TaxID=1869339 RepID=UPI0025CDCDC0|nr:tail fiber domain-containing protein [Polaromonas sp.]
MSLNQSQAQQASEFFTAPTNAKKKYKPPGLVCYGCVSVLTQNGTNGSSENSTSTGKAFMATCDMRLKQDIVFVENHPLGFGLYLFDYKPEFSELYGSGRQFGVMAQEVETVMPDAVVTYGDGFKRVNYAMLGVSLSPRRVH